MRAVIFEEFGGPDVLRVADVAEPTAGPGEARIRVEAAALNPKDVLIRKGKLKLLMGTDFPKIPGYDFAGILLDDADGLTAGTEVYGMIQSHRGGACAEMVAVPHDQFARKPPELSMAEAASVPLVGLTALQALRDELEVQPGDTVLMNGASGGVGTLAIQIARVMGCDVVGVSSAPNHALLRRLGASRVIDYRETDPTSERGLDHFFDIYGNKSWSQAKGTLTDEGRYCSTVPGASIVARSLLGKIGLSRASLVVVKSRRDDLEQLSGWVSAGLLEPVVDRIVPLEESDEGHRHLETRRARGKVVVEI